MAEQSVEVLNGKVGDTNVADLASINQLLHLAPGVDIVPVLIDLLLARHRRGGPVDEVQVDIVSAEIGQAVGNGFADALVVGVVQLGGNPDLVARDARGLDALTDFLFVAVRGGRVDVAVAGAQSSLDSLGDLIGLGLPSSETNGRDLVARAEGKGASARLVRARVGRLNGGVRASEGWW